MLSCWPCHVPVQWSMQGSFRNSPETLEIQGFFFIAACCYAFTDDGALHQAGEKGLICFRDSPVINESSLINWKVCAKISF